jgi:hypothetical protein
MAGISERRTLFSLLWVTVLGCGLGPSPAEKPRSSLTDPELPFGLDTP